MNRIKRAAYCIFGIPALVVDLFIWIWTGRGYFLSNKLGDWSQNVKR